MKNWQKLSLTLILIIILFFIATSLLVKSYLAPETIKLLVIPKIEEIVSHDISYTNLEVDIGGAIKLENLTIADPSFPQKAILQSKDMILHCRIFPLLSKKIIIEEITLHQPQINLIRDKQGKYNFIKYKPEGKKKVVGKERRDKVLLETTLSFTVTHLNIKNGELAFTDHTKTSSAPFQLRLKNINLQASDISMVSSFPLDISAEIVSTPPSFIKLKAFINPLSKEVKSEIQLTPLNITHFASYFPELPFNLQKGFCSLDLKMTANSSLDFYSQGLISIKDINLSPVKIPDDEIPAMLLNSLHNATIDLDHSLSYKSADDLFLLERLNTSINKVNFSLEGKIEECKTYPLFDFTFKTKKLSVKNILESIPQDLVPGGEDLFPSGTTEANLSIKGSLKKLEDLRLNGSLVIDKLQIGSKQMPGCKAQIEGKISFNGHVISLEQLKTTFKDSSLILKGRINNYIKGPLSAEVYLNSPSFVLNDIIYCLEKDKDRRRIEGIEREKQERDEIGPFNFDQLKIKADISLDSINYKNLHLSDLKAKCLLQNNVFILESLEGMLENGLLHLKSRIDLGVKGLDYTLQFTGNNLNLNSIITSFAPDLQQEIYGIMDLNADLRGRGTNSDTFKKNLKGGGKIYIEEGKVSGLKPLQSLASFIKVDKLNTIEIDQAQGSFQIEGGIVHTENSLKGKEIEFYPKGTISLDSHLDLSLNIRLSPDLSEQIVGEALTKYFKDERGWTIIALTIKGPPGELIVMPAPATISDISEMIVDIILKKEETDIDKREDKKKALEDLLKGLIKKSKQVEP